MNSSQYMGQSLGRETILMAIYGKWACKNVYRTKYFMHRKWDQTTFIDKTINALRKKKLGK